MAADARKATDGPSTSSLEAWDYHTLPDWDNDFVDEDDILAFASALAAPDTSPSEEDLLSAKQQNAEFITALNDWKPVRQTVKGLKSRKGDDRRKSRVKRRKKPQRGRDETRQGFTYHLLKYPFLFFVFAWLFFLGFTYLLTRLYIYLYEHLITWRGKRERLRRNIRRQTSYDEWVKAAKAMDAHLGSDQWKDDDEYAYYDSKTIHRAKEQMQRLRYQAELDEQKVGHTNGAAEGHRAVDDLKGLAESCLKNNFAGYENPRLYSETYYGTKDLVQSFVDEGRATLQFLFSCNQLSQEEKHKLAQHLNTNFGRTALCLSGGATFAYYHFGIAKALLDAGLLPPIITGTSGGALVAALLATRTDEELKRLLIPALATRITACSDPFSVWFRRWWRTGARFDNVDWAKRCAWFCHGSLTFLEAYQRTGRVLNVTCVPSDPHSPSILANYLTAPDCVVWSAVLASAAVPGILNPVVLMRKNREGKLEPYSFGHKWKDGSLRTDIPLKSLNLHFNVNFSIVSQVNPHINLFFFSSRGSVGRPVTHRRGRGWRGGFLGSAIEQYIKLDLTKWLKVLRHLELLPRPMGQDWSEIWLQRFSGTITIWPRSIISDFFHILSDPSMQRLARMIHVGQLAAWPKLKFISNRMAIEQVIEDARHANRPRNVPQHATNQERGLRNMFSEEDLKDLLAKARSQGGSVEVPARTSSPLSLEVPRRPETPKHRHGNESPSFSKRISDMWKGNWQSQSSRSSIETVRPAMSELAKPEPEAYVHRRESIMEELKRQTNVFFDDEPPDTDAEHADTDQSDTDAEDDAAHSDVSDDKQRMGRPRADTGSTDASEEEAVQDSEGEDDLLGRERHGTFVG